MKVTSGIDGGENLCMVEMSEQEALRLIEDLSRTLQGGLTIAGYFQDDSVHYQRVRIAIRRQS